MISVLPNNLSKEPLKLEVKISYETLKKALVQAAKVNNMPVEVVEDKYCVSDGSWFGGLGSKSIRCLAVYHNKHKKDYYVVVLELKEAYGIYYLYDHMGGTSRNQRDINMSNMSNRSSRSLLGEIIGNSAKSKMRDENLYYDAVYEMISSAIAEAEEMTINPSVDTYQQYQPPQSKNNTSKVGQTTTYSGKSIDKLDKSKLEALIKASDDGEEWAQREYGRIIDEYDMDPDFIELVCQLRVNIYQNPAKRGDKNAILRYAYALARLGRKKEAYDWYMNLIQKGDTDAMLALSEQYNEHGSFGHNPNEEIKWLKLAGNGGNAEAQNKLGLECLCVNDKHNALLWYELSAKQNNPGGKIGYAECLRDQLSALDEYSKGWDEVTPGRYDYIKKTYGQMSHQQCRSVMNDLYWKIEKLYLDGLDHCNSDNELSKAFSGLSSLYLYPQGVCHPMFYLSAFYDFENFRVLENKFAYERCLKTIDENNLKVTKKDLQEWENIGVFEWADKHGIDIYPKEILNTKSATDSKKTTNTANDNKKDEKIYSHATRTSNCVAPEKVVDYIIEQFKIENNVDLSSDKLAVQRIQEAVNKNISLIQNGENVLISLPFITASAQGPLHLDVSVSLDGISSKTKTDEGNLDVNLTLNITEQEARNGSVKIVAVKEIGKKYKLTIPVGIKDGTVLRLSGAGKKDLVNGKKGNVFVKVQIHEKIFEGKKGKTDNPQTSKGIEINNCDFENFKNLKKLLSVNNFDDMIVCLKFNNTSLQSPYFACKKKYESKYYGFHGVKAISAGFWHVVGLNSDGTVQAKSHGSSLIYSNQCDVDGWNNIVAVSASGNSTVGLRMDGTVCAAGDVAKLSKEIKYWNKIVDVCIGHDGWQDYVIGLKSDGTVVQACCSGAKSGIDVSKWKDIIAVSAKGDHAVGLKHDGTVLATGKNTFGQCDVSSWKDIVSISAGVFNTIGLKSDGSVVIVGDKSHGIAEVEKWENMLAVCAGKYCALGIDARGRIKVAGKVKYGKDNIEKKYVLPVSSVDERERLIESIIRGRTNFLKQFKNNM